MSIRHLDSFFDPASVVVIGANSDPSTLGAVAWRNLCEGGFAGARWAVDAEQKRPDGDPGFAKLQDLPAAPELAVIASAAADVPGLVAELGAMGTRAVVVLATGLDVAHKQAMLDAARPHLLRVLGPGSLGLFSRSARLNVGLNVGAGPTPLGAAAGQPESPARLALLAQSNGLCAAMLDQAIGRGIGVSRCVALGEQADVDFADLLDWLAFDASTRAVWLQLELIQHARKFMAAARAVARNKPVLVIKAKHSSTGPTTSDAVFDAAIRRAGMLRVHSLDELFGVTQALSNGQGRSALPTFAVADEVFYHRDDSSLGAAAGGPFITRTPADSTAAAGAASSLTIVTNSAAAGALAADAAAAAGLSLAPLSQALCATLQSLLPTATLPGNPVDLGDDAPAPRYVQTLSALLSQPAAGTVLLVHAPSALVASVDIARALQPLVAPAQGRLLTCWLGDGAMREARQVCRDLGLPCHDSAEQALAAFAMLCAFHRNQRQLAQAPALSIKQPDGDAPPWGHIGAIIDTALGQGRESLNEPEAKAVLSACGLQWAAANAAGLPSAGPSLEPEPAPACARSSASGDFAWRLGAHVDRLFGPVLTLGRAGPDAWERSDSTVALPPLNLPLARAAIEHTAMARQLLDGSGTVVHNDPSAALNGVAEVLVVLSDLLATEPRILELDIERLVPSALAVWAQGLTLRFSARAAGGAERFAIRPYPAQWVTRTPWQGRQLTLRPLRPDDEARHLDFLARLDQADIRMRVFYSRRSIARSELARLTQIDYEREMAFVACAPDELGEEQTLGVARALCDPDNQDAEFGVVVRSDLKGKGLGRLLMDQLIAYWRERGTQRLVGQVLRENTGMLAFMRKLGFVVDAQQPEPEVAALHLRLQPPAEAPTQDLRT